MDPTAMTPVRSATARWLNDNIGIIDTGGYGHEGAIASYVVRSGGEAALIDVGYAATARNVMDGLGILGVDPGSVAFVFATHHHMDHMGAVPHVVGGLPRAKVVVHEDPIRFLVEPSRLVRGTYEVLRNHYAQYAGDMPPTPPERIEPLREDGSYRIGDLTLRPLYTPGHSQSHFSFYLEELSAVFTGDAVCISRPGLPLLLPEAGPPSIDVLDVNAAVKSLDRMKSLRPKALLMPHFGYMDYSDEFIEGNKGALVHFNDRISEMMGRGMNADEIAGELRRELTEGLRGYDPDEYTRSVLLGDMLRITVMGYMGALLRRRK